jgi:hypothetical protein
VEELALLAADTEVELGSCADAGVGLGAFRATTPLTEPREMTGTVSLSPGASSVTVEASRCGCIAMMAGMEACIDEPTVKVVGRGSMDDCGMETGMRTLVRRPPAIPDVVGAFALLFAADIAAMAAAVTKEPGVGGAAGAGGAPESPFPPSRQAMNATRSAAACGNLPWNCRKKLVMDALVNKEYDAM